MALFFECTDNCALNKLDEADIVRDGAMERKGRQERSDGPLEDANSLRKFVMAVEVNKVISPIASSAPSSKETGRQSSKLQEQPPEAKFAGSYIGPVVAKVDGWRCQAFSRRECIGHIEASFLPPGRSSPWFGPD
jgi:hypothetical protein